MDANYLTNPLVFLVEVIFGLYALIVLLRFLLQLMRADFYNPLSQFIVKATSPVLNPLRRFIPGVGGLDLSSLVLAWLVKSLELLLISFFKLGAPAIAASLLFAIPALLELVIDIFLFAILIQVILSWVNPGAYNPAMGVLHSLTEPLLGPARRRLPPMGGFDFSPMIVMIGLVLLQMLLLPPIKALVTSILV